MKTSRSFPCDLLLIHSLSDDDSCHMTTANLDGETNLKFRTVPDCLRSKIKNLNDLNNFRGVIKCDSPNKDLYEYKGKIQIETEE